MKAWRVSYEVKKGGVKETYNDIVVSDKVRAIRYKLSIKHKCQLKSVNILSSEVFLDSKEA